MGKKPWQTPQLIVLVRSRPEEAVLTTCKGGSLNGPVSQFAWCASEDSPPCQGCSAIATS